MSTADVVAATTVADALLPAFGVNFSTAAAVNQLAPIFGSGSLNVNEVVKKCTNPVTVSNIMQSPPTFTYCVAPSFGSLNKDSVKTMDDNLKVIMSGTIRSLGKEIKDGRPTWEKVLEVMAQNSLIQPKEGDAPVFINRTYEKKSTDVFKFDGSPNEGLVSEITAWFRSVIADEDVLRATAIDTATVTDLAKIVASTGAKVDSADAFFAKNEYTEREVLDIGIIRFPDIDRPYIQVYRLKLNAYASCKRILMVEENNNGLKVEYNSRKYEPRKSVLDGIKPAVIAKGIAEAEDLFA